VGQPLTYGILVYAILALLMAPAPDGIAAVAIAESRMASGATPDDFADEEFVDDDFAPGLFVLVMLALLVFVILVGVGIAIGLAIVALAAALISLGIVSSSVVVGIVRRRPGDAFRALFLQLGAAAGIAAGVGVLWLMVSLFDLAIGLGWVILVGGLVGLAGGLAIGLMFNFAWTRATRWTVARINRWRGKKPEAQATEPPRIPSGSETSSEEP
jgi:hypothetical protein